jgi:hypothetical protein
VQNHLNDDSPRHGLNTRLLARCASSPNHQRTGTSLRGEPLRNVISLERRRVPRTFWGSNEPRADAVAPWRAMRPYLIQMGVWCASANDVQPRERKTGCAWTDDRESSDASTRQRFRAPLDKGPVNGRPQSGGQSGGRRPRLCKNSRDRFLPVNFSHVDAISGDISASIRLLAILRAGRNEFSHSLGQQQA